MLLNIFITITIVFFCLATYMLFAPLLLEINTHTDLYRFSIVPVLSIRWVTKDSPYHLEIRVFGIRKKLTLPGFQKNKKEIKIQKRSKYQFSIHQFISVLRSFKVKKCFVNIDTGDMPLNGELYPMMYILSDITGNTFQINFMGKKEIIITIKNNAFRILRAFINSNKKTNQS